MRGAGAARGRAGRVRVAGGSRGPALAPRSAPRSAGHEVPVAGAVRAGAPVARGPGRLRRGGALLPRPGPRLLRPRLEARPGLRDLLLRPSLPPHRGLLLRLRQGVPRWVAGPRWGAGHSPAAQGLGVPWQGPQPPAPSIQAGPSLSPASPGPLSPRAPSSFQPRVPQALPSRSTSSTLEPSTRSLHPSTPSSIRPGRTAPPSVCTPGPSSRPKAPVRQGLDGRCGRPLFLKGQGRLPPGEMALAGGGGEGRPGFLRFHPENPPGPEGWVRVAREGVCNDPTVGRGLALGTSSWRRTALHWASPQASPPAGPLGFLSAVPSR